MKIKFTFLLLFCSAISLTYAQKNAPVAGDAAQLADLLKKDYKSIDPSTVDDELIKDRAFVIATFKSYMTEQQKGILTTIKTNTIANAIKNIKAYKDAQLTLATVSKEKNSNMTNYAGEIAIYAKKVEDTKAVVNNDRFLSDSSELCSLESVYNSENKYVSHIINQFLLKYQALKNNGPDVAAKSNPNASLQKGIPFVGGDMGFEVVIEGLSKFLAKRIKEELTTSVIEKVQEWLKKPGEGDPLAELKVLLPRTNNFLLNFSASQVTNFPNEIKQYIEDDFNHIIENMGGLKNTPRIQRLIINHPDIDFAMEALELIPNLSKIKNPIDYFETIENSRNINRWKESQIPAEFNIAHTLQLSAMLAHSYSIIENGQPRFAGNDFINAYSSDLNFYFLYVGFLRQQNTKYYDIQFMINTENKFHLSQGMDSLINKFSSKKIEDLKKDRDFFTSSFVQIGKNSEKVYNSALEVKKANKKGDHIGADTIYTFVKSVIDLAEEVTVASDTLVNYFMMKAGLIKSKAKSDLDIQPLKLKKKTEPYFKIANTTNSILLDLQKKKYAIGIIKALEITTEVLPDQLKPNMNYLTMAVRMADIETKTMDKEWFKEDWTRLMSEMNKVTAGEEIEVGKKMKASAAVVYSELEKVKNFMRSNYDIDHKTLTNFATLMGKIAQMKTISKVGIDGTEEQQIKDLLKNKDFQYILLSYYTKLSVDEMSNKLERELREFTVDIKGNTIHIFDSTDAENLKKSFTTYVNASFNYLVFGTEKDFKDANAALKNTATILLLRAPEKFKFTMNENTIKIVHFVNDMALSTNSDDIEKAIEAFALPSGSYSIKRKAIFNIAVNSYPGILPSAELTWKNKSCYTGFSPAFTVPIGLSFTWGTPKGFSHGIFVPVIDIGAVTRMHLTDDLNSDSTKVNTLPEFNFLSVFSPGVYYHLGLKKTPLSIHIGVQYGPGLKEIRDDGTTKMYESLRIGAGLVMDIPLLNLHTKPRFKE